VSTPVTLRDTVRPPDAQRVREIVAASGFFSPAEVDVAVELVDERLTKGEASGYHFLFAEDPEGAVSGYTCFGEIPCTVGSYDLYWIAVDPARRRAGLGKLLLRATEHAIAARGGRAVYIETSNRALYDPTRRFYLACGYTEQAVLKDFYNDGDDKVIYARRLAQGSQAEPRP
jgi:ribosomal protein S18 acetylase RimI-like enzyme